MARKISLLRKWRKWNTLLLLPIGVIGFWTVGCGPEGKRAFYAASFGDKWADTTGSDVYSETNPAIWHEIASDGITGKAVYLIVNSEDESVVAKYLRRFPGGKRYLVIEGSAVSELAEIQQDYPFGTEEHTGRFFTVVPRYKRADEIFPSGVAGETWMNFSLVLEGWPFAQAKETPNVKVSGRPVPWEDFLRMVREKNVQVKVEISG